MTQKVAYLWGPVSNFSGPLAASLVKKGWTVHIPTKSSLNIFSLSPLDLKSSARSCLELSFGGREKFRTFQDRLKFVDPAETARAGTAYDAIIFCGLPPNFDEPRVPRAPWAAAELPGLMRSFRNQPVFVVSSIWGGIQADGVVPEECEFERRKPQSQWESLCQHYELRLLEGLSQSESPWFLVRLPLIGPDSANGEAAGFAGPMTLFKELSHVKEGGSHSNHKKRHLRLNYNPDANFWFLPHDVISYMFARFIEDESRPRILNLVSTQGTLNREWLSDLAKQLGYAGVEEAEKDDLSLSSVVRKLLNDNVQVKTRNLFEVASRYQMPRAKIDEAYFSKVLDWANARNWGQPAGKEERRAALKFSERLATYYFEEFIPSNFDEGLLKRATAHGTTIGFILKDAESLGWILKSRKGKAVVERFDPQDEKPRICFHLTAKTMTQLMQCKLPLHRALLLREVEVEGPLLQALRVANAIEQFLKEHPFDQKEFADQEAEKARV
ncbi:MAG TPA: hypothetical protein V6D17_04740 [Candidatus Obscuribacterales bacterium]